MNEMKMSLLSVLGAEERWVRAIKLFGKSGKATPIVTSPIMAIRLFHSTARTASTLNSTRRRSW